MKAFADDKLNLAKKFKFGLGRVENIVEENASNPASSPFPTLFSKGFYFRVVKVGIVW